MSEALQAGADPNITDGPWANAAFMFDGGGPEQPREGGRPALIKPQHQGERQESA